MKFDIFYGLTVVRPECFVKFVAPPPPTFAEWVHMTLMEFWIIAVPSFWLALSITAFRWAFGGFDR